MIPCWFSKPLTAVSRARGQRERRAGVHLRALCGSVVKVLSQLWLAAPASAQDSPFRLTPSGYFSRGGVDVMAFSDFYPEGHQGGV